MFPELAMVEPGMEGVAESEAALRFWREEWAGQSFMAIGAKHLLLSLPARRLCNSKSLQVRR